MYREKTKQLTKGNTIMNNAFSEYKQEVVKNFGECTILHSNVDLKKKNCGNTGDREAYKGVSWIDYWRAMTGNTDATMCCSSCGKEIFVGEPTSAQKEMFSKGDDKVEKHRAHGGHIWVVTPANKKYTGGRYIIPLCPECNGQHGKEINIRNGSVYCKELGATIS